MPHTHDPFNLLDEPWIPELDAGGHASEVSLINLFRRAPHIRALSGDVSTQSFALLRLCLAILHRAVADFTPENVDDVPSAIEDLAADWSGLVLLEVENYLRVHRDRFDLFHPEQPFFQTPGLRTAKGDFSDLSRIVVDVPNGAPFLTMRSAHSLRSISAAEAARWVVHTQAYDTSGIKTGVVGHPRAKGGKAYPEGVAWTGQLGGLHLVGSNLATTLLLNLWAVLPDDDAQLAADLPPWERPTPRVENLLPAVDTFDPARPAGPVDVYTWQPRQLLLEGGRDGVTGVLLTYADRFILQERQNLVKLESMTLWRYSKPQTAKYKKPIQMTRKHQPGSALWRGLANVLPPGEVKGAEAPAPSTIVQHASRLRGTSLLLDGIIHLRAISVEYGSQESVVDEIVEDSLDLPAILLDSNREDLRLVATTAVDLASDGVGLLVRLAGNVAAAAGASGDALNGPRNRARDAGYAALDPLYRAWLRTSLPRHQADPSLAERDWQALAWRTIRILGEEVVQGAPDKAWKGWGASSSRVDVGRADAFFRSALAKTFPLAFAAENQESTQDQTQERGALTT